MRPPHLQSYASQASLIDHEPSSSGQVTGIELTLETAKELRAAHDRAIAAAEFEEAEVRGKGAVSSLVRAA